MIDQSVSYDFTLVKILNFGVIAAVHAFAVVLFI